MFREMRRFKQKLSEEECLTLLKEEKRGVLSVLGDDGYPYGVPMDFWYDEESGHIFFHGAVTGHKIDAIKRDDKVSFCVYNQGYIREGEWAYNVSSVILFGRIQFVEDKERAIRFLRNFGHKYTDDHNYVEKEIVESTPHTLCLELIPEHMTGKLVNES